MGKGKPLITKICYLHEYCIYCGGNTFEIMSIVYAHRIVCKYNDPNNRLGDRQEKKDVIKNGTKGLTVDLLHL